MTTTSITDQANELLDETSNILSRISIITNITGTKVGIVDDDDEDFIDLELLKQNLSRLSSSAKKISENLNSTIDKIRAMQSTVQSLYEDI